MRTQITEDGQKTAFWFDMSRANSFKESTEWDGRNWRSKTTGSQFVHERLFQAASGRWIINKWSDFQGSTETYEIISFELAAEWLLRNDHEVPEEIAGNYEI